MPVAVPDGNATVTMAECCTHYPGCLRPRWPACTHHISLWHDYNMCQQDPVEAMQEWVGFVARDDLIHAMHTCIRCARCSKALHDLPIHRIRKGKGRDGNARVCTCVPIAQTGSLSSSIQARC